MPSDFTDESDPLQSSSSATTPDEDADAGLRPVRHDESSVVRTAGGFERAVRRYQNHPSRSALVVIATALLVGGGVAILWGRYTQTLRLVTMLQYQAGLLSAQAEIDRGNPVAALEILRQTPKSQRSVEFQLIASQVTETLKPIAVPVASTLDSFHFEMLTTEDQALWRSNDQVVLASTEDGRLLARLNIAEVQEAANLGREAGVMEPGFMHARVRPNGELVMFAREKNVDSKLRNRSVAIRIILSGFPLDRKDTGTVSLGKVDLGYAPVIGSESQTVGGILHTGTMDDYEKRILTLWDVTTREVVFERDLKGKGGSLRAKYAINRPGTHLALLFEQREDLSLTTYRVLNSKVEIVELATGNSTSFVLGNGNPGYRRIELSSDGMLLAVETTSGHLEIWNAEAQERQAIAEEVNLGFQTESLFSADGTRVAFTGKLGAGLFEWKSDSSVRYLSGHTALHFADDHQIVTRRNRDHFRWFFERDAVATWKHSSKSGSIYFPRINSLRLSQDASRLLSTNLDGKVRIWNTLTGTELNAFQGAPGTHGALSRDGRVAALAVQGESGTLVRLFDVDSGTTLNDFPGSGVIGLPKENRIVFVHQWLNGKEIESALLLSNWQGSERHQLSDNTVVGFGTSTDGLIGTVEAQPLPDRPLQLGASLSLNVYDSNRATRLWSTSKSHGRMLAFLPQIAFSADGRFIASHIEVFSGFVDQTRKAKVTDNTLTVQDATNGQVIREVKLETSVDALCFSPDGRRVLIDGADGKTLFYDVATRTLVHSAHLTPKDPSAFAFSADGQRLFIGDQDGNIVVIPVNDEIASPQ